MINHLHRLELKYKSFEKLKSLNYKWLNLDKKASLVIGRLRRRKISIDNKTDKLSELIDSSQHKSDNFIIKLENKYEELQKEFDYLERIIHTYDYRECVNLTLYDIVTM